MQQIEEHNTGLNAGQQNAAQQTDNKETDKTMKKKKYVKPTCKVIRIEGGFNMIASSIQNIEGDTQHGIEENGEDGFEAGSKDKKWGDLWDE